MRGLLLTFAVVFANLTAALPKSINVVINEEVITESYIGNGAQWGGYDILPAWINASTLSEADWAQMAQRIEFMRPPIVRIMISPGWNYLGEKMSYDSSKSEGMLFPILDFCQANNIAVQFGEWGHMGTKIPNKKSIEKLKAQGKEIPEPTVNLKWVALSTRFMCELVKERNYSCIKYFTAVNEPNGNWSSIKGRKELWAEVVRLLYESYNEAGLTDHFTFMAPDIAVWNTKEMGWFDLCNGALSSIVGAYDLHSYPSRNDLHSGKYREMLRGYRQNTPADKALIIGELGFKEKEKEELGKLNAQRIAADPFASPDSQMSIYDASYAIDMADATMQAIEEGLAGVIYWSMDDAMYNVDGTQQSTKLKRWGLWNSVGEELCKNPEDEALRPWYFTCSLLCRFLPAGCSIREVVLPVDSNVRAICSVLNGRYTIALLNSGNDDVTVQITLRGGTKMEMQHFSFAEDAPPADFMPVMNDKAITIDLTKSFRCELQRRSFQLFTNIK